MELLDEQAQMECMKADAALFLKAIANVEWRPVVWEEVGEIGVEWIADNKHAFVSLEGDGISRYTMMIDGDFQTGKFSPCPVDILPDDLADYLQNL